MKQWLVATNTKAALVLLAEDAKNRNAYHGCATFKDASSRTVENVHSIKAFWLDLDCGASKPYAHQADAEHALSEFCADTGLPDPYIINSGDGLHVYWVLNEAVSLDAWLPVASLLKQVTAEAGLHAGPERTADAASILRTPGTYHRKSTPKLVNIYASGSITNIEHLSGLLQRYADEHGIVSSQPSTASSLPMPLGTMPSYLKVFTSAAQDLSSGVYGEPVSADAVADNCAVIREFRDKAGNIPEPLWRSSIGVVRLTQDGEAVCHDWSSGFSGYTHAETQAKIDSFAGMGATKCATLEGLSPGACNGCPLKGRGKSPLSSVPLQLVAPVVLPAPLAPGVAAPAPVFPPDFRWGQMHGATGIWHDVVEKDPSSPSGFKSVTKMISDTLFYPIGSIENRDQTNIMYLRIELPGRFKDFPLETRYINEGGAKLHGLLGQHQITFEKGMNVHIQTLLSKWMSHQRKNVTPTRSYEKFGWHGKDFLIGDTLLKANGTEETVMLTGSAFSRRENFIPTGTLQKWIDIVDRAYNHKGSESLQFSILTGLATPLLKMFNDYGGVTVYMHSEGTGAGKTTTERAALSAWCSWQKLQITDKQATTTATYSIMGMMSNLPVIIDELTNKPNDEVSEMIHLISSGSPKQRCDQRGAVIDRDSRWETFVLASGNLLLSEKLGQHRAHAEAEVARIFEFTVPKSGDLPIQPTEALQLFPQFSENYGHAGRVFARYVVDNYDAVRAHLLKTQAALVSTMGLTQGERYWSVLIASVLTTQTIAAKLGLVQFPRAGLIAWIKDTLASNRGIMNTSVVKMDDLLSQMLMDLWQGMLITHGLGDLYKGWDAFVVQDPRGTIVGRVVVPQPGPIGVNDKPAIYIATSAARAWCNKRGVSAKEVFKSGVAGGLVKPTEARFQLGRGSSRYAGLIGSAPCWEVDFKAAGSIVPAVPAQHGGLVVFPGGKL